MSPAKSPRVKLPPAGDAFEYGARVLKISVDALLKLYDTTISVLHEGISVGKTDGTIGTMSFMAYADLLHGGAYAAPINQLPHFAEVMQESPYYAGNIRNQPASTWLSWLAQNTAGENASDMMSEVLEDSNVPHVFPKLLSDPMYAQLKLGYAQVLSADIFLKGSTGVSTLVEGITKGAQRLGLGFGGGGEEEKGGYSEAEIMQTQRLLALFAPKG